MQTEVNNAIKILKQGGIILYPTDTVWGIGCDATNFDAIEKIFKLKKRIESKSLICLVSDLKMLNYYIQEIPEAAYNILKYADKPTTIIYDKPVRVAKNLIAQTQYSLEEVKANILLVQKYRKELLSFKQQQLTLIKKGDSFSELNKNLLKQNHHFQQKLN